MQRGYSAKNFPKHFLWGASTSSHQVEGNNVNQWSVWELEHAQEHARGASRRFGSLPNWRMIKRHAEIPENYVSGRGVEHFVRYREDFDIASKQLGLNAFRFGIEWSRIQPEEDTWNETAIQHYKKYIAGLRTRNLEPFLNIWHWTIPTWFADKGGFSKAANLHYFDDFVRKLADELIPDVDFVITLNEPNVYASFGYGTGEWPPGEKNWLTFLRVYLNLTKAHKHAYRILKAKKPNVQIGIAQALANIQPANPESLSDRYVTRGMQYGWNWWFLRRIRSYQDFIGVNYYFTHYFSGLRNINPLTPVNDMGWYMEPSGLYSVLITAWARFKKPIYVTENGLADAQDQYRRWWLEESLAAMEHALHDGVDVRGYFYWSLLDNFEWAHGWWPKFGLVEVDQKTMKRTVRPSAKWFATVLKQKNNH